MNDDNYKIPNAYMKECFNKNIICGNSLVVQELGLHASTAWVLGSIPAGELGSLKSRDIVTTIYIFLYIIYKDILCSWTRFITVKMIILLILLKVIYRFNTISYWNSSCLLCRIDQPILKLIKKLNGPQRVTIILKNKNK